MLCIVSKENKVLNKVLDWKNKVVDWRLLVKLTGRIVTNKGPAIFIANYTNYIFCICEVREKLLYKRIY
ncbi:hypothetical protein D1872_168790 [compost metagenome]